MADNWMVKVEKKERTNSKKADIRYNKLSGLFTKYTVSYEEQFSIITWSVADIKTLHKVSGYNMTFITLNDNDKIKFCKYSNTII